MTARFIVRLLDPAGLLLAWTEVAAKASPQERGASCPFFPTKPIQFVIEQAGDASQVSVHWADLDVARVVPLLTPTHVDVGQVLTYSGVPKPEPIWLVPGMRDVPVPAVTVRAPVAVSPPTGSLTAIS
jgi:hypothetical protein